jgi:hypothetical protein
LYGKYASPRDAGNFAAGAVAESSGLESIAQYGYGAYNLSGNNKIVTGIITYGIAALSTINPFGSQAAFNSIAKFGEDKLTQRSINLGKEHVKNKK